MVRDLKYLTKNARFVLLADFFWNLGRTFPHAILTVFLLTQGRTLVEIAFLQSIFMIIAMISEFPSGVAADLFSRKIVYLSSLITLFASYLLIGFFSEYLGVLIIAYTLYGLSVSLKSGTLEAEVVLEYDKAGIDIKYYSVATSYVMSVSAITGGMAGSFFYEHIHQNIYFISLVLFILSSLMASLCSFYEASGDEVKNETAPTTLIEELKKGIRILNTSKSLLLILALFAASSLFLQPFFQYWQVLYQEQGIPVRYLGVAYVVFQICNLLGAAIYKRLKINKAYVILMLCLIPLVFAINLLYARSVLIILPIVVVLFYVYNQHLDIMQKNEAPKQYMSSFFSLVGTIKNIASVASLFIMATCMNHFGIIKAYFILFIMFALISITFYMYLVNEKKQKLIKANKHL